MIKAILFDLDGTLLPMDQDVFVKDYLDRMASFLAPFGYDSQLLVKAIWAGTGAMVKNDGKTKNQGRMKTCLLSSMRLLSSNPE